jgi:hypothetical protein
MLSGGLRTKDNTKQSQESMPLITVVAVVRNGEKTLEQPILSDKSRRIKTLSIL